MRTGMPADRALLTLGIVASASLAQQTTVKAFIPYVNSSRLEEIYESFEADVLSTTGGAVVAALDLKDSPNLIPYFRATVTMGLHTFRQEYRHAITSDNNGDESAVSTHTDIYDCTSEGCPVATTGRCKYDDGSTEIPSSLGTTTFAADELTFGAFSLATPLPEALEDECEGDGGDDDSGAEGAGEDDEDSEGGDDEDNPDGTGRAAMSWLSLLPGVVLGLAM